jgi:DNA-binding NarL/FixJ family response regulator
MNKINVLISDDHPVVRAGLRVFLEAAGDIQVVGEAVNGQEAVRKTKKLRPDVVLLDVAMPRLNGVEAARQITTQSSPSKVLMLSIYKDSEQVQQAVEAGATSYVSKEAAGNDLLRAIRNTRKGIPFFSPDLSKPSERASKGPLNGHSHKPLAPILSGRETQCLKFIAEGYSTQDIATSLDRSRKTIEKHRQSLMNKLDIHEIATLTRYAVSIGVVPSNRPPALPVN